MAAVVWDCTFLVAPMRQSMEGMAAMAPGSRCRSCFDCPMSYSKPESFFEFCRVCSALVGVKQCHKPTMTGNGKFLTPIKNREIGGTVYGIVLPTVPKKIHHGQLHPAAQVSISRARDHSTLGGELAVQVWTWRDWNSVQRGGGKIMGWWLKMVLILNYSPVNCYITMENHHVS